MHSRAALCEVYTGENLSTWLLNALSIIGCLLLSSCLSRAHLDTARPLDRGEQRWSLGGGLGYLDGAGYSYARARPRHGSTPAPLTTPSSEAPPAPVIEHHGDLPVTSLRGAYSYGLTAALDLFAAVDFIPGAFSAQLGAKVSALGSASSGYALALRPRVAQVMGGFSSESILITDLELALPNTFSLARSLDLTLSPQLAFAWFTRNDPYGTAPVGEGDIEEASPPAWETMRARAWLWGGGLCLTHYPSGDRMRGAAYFYELSVSQSPSFELNRRGALQLTVSVGARAAADFRLE